MQDANHYAMLRLIIISGMIIMHLITPSLQGTFAGVILTCKVWGFFSDLKSFLSVNEHLQTASDLTYRLSEYSIPDTNKNVLREIFTSSGSQARKRIISEK